MIAAIRAPRMPRRPMSDATERLMADLRAAVERVKSPLAPRPGTTPPTTCWACRGPIGPDGRSRAAIGRA